MRYGFGEVSGWYIYNKVWFPKRSNVSIRVSGWYIYNKVWFPMSRRKP